MKAQTPKGPLLHANMQKVGRVSTAPCVPSVLTITLLVRPDGPAS